MKKYNGPSVRQGCTDTGKLPASVGCCNGGGGVIRKLTKKELAQQRKLQRHA